MNKTGLILATTGVARFISRRPLLQNYKVRAATMSSQSSPEVGTTGSATLVVSPTDLASVLSADPQDQYPAVFATSRLVALMEIASARIISPHLSPGQLSVGVTVDISHTAPTPIGASVTANSTLTGIEGKLFVFEVSAMDDAGSIGKGVHKRAIVDSARLESAAKKRLNKGESL